MTACCQITCAIPWLPCEQLPYPPKHPRISRIRRRDNSDLPLSYKYFLLRYSSSILSFYILNPTSLAAALFENFKNSGKDLLYNLPSLRSFPPLRKKWPSTLSSLRSTQHPLSSFYHILDLSQNYLLGIFSLSFPCLCNLQTFRSWLRKLLFPPINPTSNALVHWETQILPIW